MVMHPLKQSQLHLQNLSNRLQHPKQRLQQQAQKLDDIEQRFHLAIKNNLKHISSHLHHMSNQLLTNSPVMQVRSQQFYLCSIYDQLKAAINSQFKLYSHNVINLGDTLDTLSL